MMYRQKKNPYRIGRHPGYQGPRSLLSDQDRIEKLATGETSSVLSNQGIDGQRATEREIRLREKVKIGTWNVRGFNKCGKLQLLSKELERVGLLVCGFSETKNTASGDFNTCDGHRVLLSG